MPKRPPHPSRFSKKLSPAFAAEAAEECRRLLDALGDPGLRSHLEQGGDPVSQSAALPQLLQILLGEPARLPPPPRRPVPVPPPQSAAPLQRLALNLLLVLHPLQPRLAVEGALQHAPQQPPADRAAALAARPDAV